MGNSTGDLGHEEKLYNACKKATTDDNRDDILQEVQDILKDFTDTSSIKAALNAHHGMNCYTVLHVAAMKNNLDVVTVLLEKCKEAKSTDSIEATDSSFQTALHKASKEGYKEIVSVLLQYDADEKAEDRYGRTPLELAQENYHDATYQLLNTETLILQLFPETPDEIVDLCKNKLSKKGLMLVEYPIKDCLKVRGDLGALLEVKAVVQAVLYEYYVKQTQLHWPDGFVVELPKIWNVMNLDEGVKQIKLKKTEDEEYAVVENEFRHSKKTGEIIDIQRIQNPALYLQYAAKKHIMETNSNCANCEKLLFHGTNKESIDKINAQGFNRAFAGQNAALYGNGVYFAVNASYSADDTYSKPDSDGHKHIYLCLVLTGSYTVGKAGMRVPPPKDDPANPAVLYDSVVDKMENPSMFIVFQDCQAYPQYLINFKNSK